jgi:LytS/YehU family sensor histidine kinase
MFVGAVTDLLSVALTAGMFHYGYFIAAILYGLLGGLIRSIINATRGKQLEFNLISTGVIAAVMGLSILFVNIINLSDADPIKDGKFVTSLLGMNIILTRMQVSWVIATVFITGILVL